ncbi:MAG TPA: DUF1738 domain-containing protein [Thermodesulfatator sp.]|nr:DUF1738 domain-containing protein [Thermodesulfatator sp.]
MREKPKKARDLYREVTDRVIKALEAGVGPWVRPWYSGAEHRNALSKRPYRGINILLLNLAYMERGFALPLWLTYREAKQLGGHVRKGEKGTTVVFWKILEKPEIDHEGQPILDPETGEQRKVRIPFLRHYTVFNVEQCEGLKLKLEPTETEEVKTNKFELAERILSLPRIRWGERACYNPSLDIITLPPKNRFGVPAAYYATALHETVHWTGHESRLNRQFGHRFGSEAYAFEELIAEMGSAFLGAHVGIPFEQVQHPEYIASWLKVLRNDKRAIFTAAREAQKACDWLLSQAGIKAREEPEQVNELAA